MKNSILSLKRTITRAKPRKFTTVDHQMVLAFMLVERVQALRAGDSARVEALTQEIQRANPMFFDWAYSANSLQAFAG